MQIPSPEPLQDYPEAPHVPSCLRVAPSPRLLPGCPAHDWPRDQAREPGGSFCEQDPEAQRPAELRKQAGWKRALTLVPCPCTVFLKRVVAVGREGRPLGHSATSVHCGRGRSRAAASRAQMGPGSCYEPGTPRARPLQLSVPKSPWKLC